MNPVVHFEMPFDDAERRGRPADRHRAINGGFFPNKPDLAGA